MSIVAASLSRRVFAAAALAVFALAAVPAMAVAIEATDTINIGARVFCIDYRQPVMFAKELATLAFFAEGRLERVPARPLDDEVDPTGAGDAFMAAYLVSRSSGYAPVPAARRASEIVADVLSRRLS